MGRWFHYASLFVILGAGENRQLATNRKAKNMEIGERYAQNENQDRQSTDKISHSIQIVLQPVSRTIFSRLEVHPAFYASIWLGPSLDHHPG